MKHLELFFSPDLFGLDFTGKDARSRFLELLHPLVDERLMNAELGTESAMVFSPQRAARATLALKAGAWFFRLDMCVLLGWLSSYHTWPNLGDHLFAPSRDYVQSCGTPFSRYGLKYPNLSQGQALPRRFMKFPSPMQASAEVSIRLR